MIFDELVAAFGDPASYDWDAPEFSPWSLPDIELPAPSLREQITLLSGRPDVTTYTQEMATMVRLMTGGDRAT